LRLSELHEQSTVHASNDRFPIELHQRHLQEEGKTMFGQLVAKVIFVIMVASPAQEKDAGLLIDSIRAFGGAYSNAPIYVVSAVPDPVPPGAKLKEKVTKVIPLQMPESPRSFPFADKVYACAQVEEMVEKEADWLVWLNPEMLVLAEPTLIAGPPTTAAVLRPVHLRNVGSLANEPLDDFWQGVYQAAAADPARAWPVESYVDRRQLRAYYNSGFMGYRPSRGVFRAWRKCFEAVLADAPLLAKMCPDNQHKIFLHQALLSTVTVGMLREDEIIILPPVYGYPLTLQKSIPEDRRTRDLNPLVTLIHDGGLEELLKSMEVDPKLKSWLLENGITR